MIEWIVMCVTKEKWTLKTVYGAKTLQMHKKFSSDLNQFVFESDMIFNFYKHWNKNSYKDSYMMWFYILIV